jgi:hypothetical protein
MPLSRLLSQLPDLKSAVAHGPGTKCGGYSVIRHMAARITAAAIAPRRGHAPAQLSESVPSSTHAFSTSVHDTESTKYPSNDHSCMAIRGQCNTLPWAVITWGGQAADAVAANTTAMR